MRPVILASIAGGLGAVIYALAAESAQKRSLNGLDPPPYRLPSRYRVSLVSPTLMEADYVPLLLASAHNQTEPFSELLIVDSSPDGDPTAEVASELGARVIHHPRGNLAAARNAGAMEVSGEILVFCDGDVVLPCDFVETAVDYLEAGAFAVHPREAIYDSRLWNLTTFWAASLSRSSIYTTRCVAVWRDVFEAVGGYDETCNPLEGCREDLSLGTRLADVYGRRSLEVLPVTIGTSARRQQKLGLEGWKQWALPVRAESSDHGQPQI